MSYLVVIGLFLSKKYTLTGYSCLITLGITNNRKDVRSQLALPHIMTAFTDGPGHLPFGQDSGFKNHAVTKTLVALAPAGTDSGGKRHHHGA
jgi:hypothetical protein